MGANGQNDLKITELKAKKVELAVYPVWDDDTQSLYYINFFAVDPEPAIYRYSYRDDMTYSAVIPGSGTIGFVYPARQGCKDCADLFLIGNSNDVSVVKWDGKSPQAQVVGKELISIEPNNTQTHVNLALADRHGRLYVGTFSLQFCAAPTADSSLYRYTNDRGLTRLFTGVRATSGIAIDYNARKLYHVGGCNLLLTAYDYDPKTGDICKYSLLFHFYLQ